MKILLLSLITLICSTSFAQVPNYVPQSGLRCYYPFTGNANDASAAASHLTNSGAVLTTDRFGATASAYSFNGTSQSMSTTTPNFTLSATGSFTFSVWIEKTTTPGGVALINGSTAGGNFIWLMQGGTNMTFGTNKQNSSWIYASAPLTISNWEHYVGVYNNGAMTFYRNNVVESTATFTYTSVTSANLPFYIGKGISGGYFPGKIDDLGLWDRALTPCEINDLFMATPTITTVNAGLDQTICPGANVTLTGAGASTYSWNNGVTNGVSFTPTATQTYTVTGTDGAGCSAWDQVVVNVGASSLNAGNDTTICKGSALVLTGTGGTGFSWNNSVQNGVSFVPASSGTYTLSGTDTGGCPATDQVVVTLYQPPINAGADLSKCQGLPVTLTATGGSTYSWNNSVQNGVSFVPSGTGYYIVVGTDAAGCSKTDSLLLTVIPSSNIQAGADISACVGDFVTLAASGGLYYIWNNGVFNNVSFPVNTTNTYVVTGADSTNCANSDTVVVTVHQATTSTMTINAIDQYDLNGTIYSTSGTYTQVVQNANGCDSTITLNLTLAFTGLSEMESNSVSWYPNPAGNMLNVSFATELNGQILHMYSDDGREVMVITLKEGVNTIDVRDLSPGVYWCQLTDDKRTNFRWVKN
jgi:hypothetical protein